MSVEIVPRPWRGGRPWQRWRPMKAVALLVLLSGCVGVVEIEGRSAPELAAVAPPPETATVEAPPADACPVCSPPPHALAECLWSSKTCVVTTCEHGWADCDGNPANGCETACAAAPCCD